MYSKSLAVLMTLVVLCTGRVRGEEPPIQAQLLDVRKIWDLAPHNAFTDLIRFQDNWYVGFREADSHAVSGDGKVRVIRSADGVGWESAALLDYGAPYDMRDAKLTVTPDGRLMLNTAAAPLASTRERQSLVWFSSNGNDWSDGPYEIGEPDWWLWGVAWGPDGNAYGVSYGNLVSDPWTTTRLYRSSNGINYESLVPTLTSDHNTNEVGLTFRADGSVVALVRQDGAGERSLVGVSDGDYTNWTFHTLNKRVGGPEILELPDGNIVAATRLYQGTTRTSLSWIDPEAGTISELLALPSGGDTSYPGLYWHDNLLWMSYYSSHEGKTSIYLAKIKVDSCGPVEPPPSGTMLFQEDLWPNSCYQSGVANLRTDGMQSNDDLVIVGETAGHADTFRGVFHFDLSDLPRGSRIHDVSLTLFAQRDDTPQSGGGSVDDRFQLDLHRLSTSFLEDQVTWELRATGVPWGEPGGDYDSNVLSSIDANPYRLLSEGIEYTWQSTPQFIQAAQAALDGGYDLFFLLRTPDGEAQNDRVAFYFHSDDASDISTHPLFRVAYGPDMVPGDANRDGMVNDLDASILATYWQYAGTIEIGWEHGDFNGDRKVTDIDASILATHWQEGTEGASPMPEPPTLLLLAGAMIGLSIWLKSRTRPARAS